VRYTLASGRPGCLAISLIATAGRARIDSKRWCTSNSNDRSGNH